MMKKQYSKVIKIVIQILFFLWIPESFAASLYAVKKLIHAVSVMDFTYAREPVLLLLETVVTTAVFGRYYCGYICSFGAAQDLSYDLGNLIRKQTKYRKKRMLSVKTDKILSKLKYPVLVIVAVSAVWKKNLLDVISPWKGFASLLSMLRGNFSKENLISAGVWICIIVLVISAVFFRAFCRYLCPMGAIYTLLSFFSLDRRKRSCKNSGDCSICPYQCKQQKSNRWGLAVTILVFSCMNLYLLKATGNETASGTADVKVTEKGSYTDGTYTGTGNGFRGKIDVTVTIKNGNISDVQVQDYEDDATYMQSVIRELIPKVLKEQSTEVDTVSGATYSSKGLLKAVDQAIYPEKTENGTDVTSQIRLKDGNYEGTANGFRGEIKVEVTVKDQKAEKIRILSYYDNEEYLFHVAPAVITEVLENKPLDTDAVSGATYSCNGLTRAIENALQVEEDTYTILEAKPRAEKHKKAHHQVQKFVESEAPAGGAPAAQRRERAAGGQPLHEAAAGGNGEGFHDGSAAALLHRHRAFHAGGVVAGFQAAEGHAAGAVEFPDDLAALAAVQRHRVGLFVAHAGVLHHHVVVGLQVSVGAQHHLGADTARVAHVEAHRFAGLDLHLGGREAHGVGHVDVDGAGDAGGVAGRADGGGGRRHGVAGVFAVAAGRERGAGAEQGGQSRGLSDTEQSALHADPFVGVDHAGTLEKPG